MARCNEIYLGTFNCAYVIMLPYLVARIGDESIEPKPKYVAIDKCLIREVIGLWEKGIKTTGCCCGHGDLSKAVISVQPEYNEKMRKMGYRELEKTGAGNYIPKTQIRYRNVIDKGFNWKVVTARESLVGDFWKERDQ